MANMTEGLAQENSERKLKKAAHFKDRNLNILSILFSDCPIRVFHSLAVLLVYFYLDVLTTKTYYGHCCSSHSASTSLHCLTLQLFTAQHYK